jgi:RimJ/RimL family protein N-acetyltransferase
MIVGDRISLRPVRTEDWSLFVEWGKQREALWGPFQRFQLDHLPQLQAAFQKGGLLQREGGFLLIERHADQTVIGFVRYTMMPVPDADLPYPEIGFGLPDMSARGAGYGREAVSLLVNYLFAGYPVERIGAFTDVENVPAQQVLERVGFQREGVLRRATFRDGAWRDICMYGLLRSEVTTAD